jgi:hypothetical protein
MLRAIVATLRSRPMRDRVRLRSLAVPTRRQFLVGAAAASLLAACGDDDISTVAGAGGEPAGAGASELSVVRFFGPYFVAGSANRVPFGLADADGLLPATAAPSEATVSVTAPDGNVVVSDLVSPKRSAGLPRPYYAFQFTPEAAGFYDFTVQTDAGEVLSQLQVVEPDDPFVAGLVGPGDQMPAVATPTVDDPAGVTPVCTRQPPCDLHRVSVADALGAPTVLLVATPAFCQTVICGPVLDILLERTGEFPEVTFVHAEVYADPEQNSSPPVPEDFAPVVADLGLAFEPVLYTVGADGTVRERLDYIFDGVEITEAVSRLVG